MSTQQPVLNEVYARRQRGKELTPYMRGEIKGMRRSGATIGAISAELNIPVNTIKKTLAKDKTRVNGMSLPRPGRPCSTSEADKNQMKLVLEQDSSATNAEIRERAGIKASDATISRLIKEWGITRGPRKKKSRTGAVGNGNPETPQQTAQPDSH